MDAQTVHASVNAPKETTGLDPGKGRPGRKRHRCARPAHHRDRGRRERPRQRDRNFKNAVVEHGRSLGIDVEVVLRDPQTKGFAPIPKRWVGEQTFGTLMLHRRLARDHEAPPAGAISMIYWSMTDVMSRRITGTTTPTWRDPPPVGVRAPTGESVHA